MKLRHLLIIFFLCITSTSFAQFSLPRQKVIGGNDVDNLTTTAITKDGGLIIGGYSNSFKSYEKSQNLRGYFDYWVVKLNKAGKIEWDKTIGGNDYDYLYSLQPTKDGGYILGGHSYSNISGEKTQNRKGNLGYGDFWVVKLDNAGNIQWDKTIGGFLDDDLRSLLQTKDGGFILGGFSSSNKSGDKTQNSRGLQDYWIVKLDSAGNKLWDKTLGGDSFDELYDMQQTIDGGYILGGRSYSNISGEKTQSSRGEYDYWVIKLDNSGNIQWDKTIGGNTNDELTSLQQSSDGGYILGGRSFSNISGEKTQNSRGGFDYWVVKLNNAGTIQWDKTIGGNDDDYLYTLKQTRDGGFITGGYSLSQVSGERLDEQRGQGDYWAVKLNNQGIIQWDKAVGGNQEDRLINIEEIAKDKYILAGYSLSDTSGDKTILKRFNYDYWLVGLVYTSGSTTTSETQNANQLLGSKKSTKEIFTVFPNPAKNVLNVTTNNPATLSLIELSGKLIRTAVINGTGTIDVSNVNQGIYYLKNNTSGTVQKVEIVK